MSLIPSNTWRDDPVGALHGPGISRPLNTAAARPFRLRITPQRGAAMIVTLSAETKRLAAVYAQNRWPESTVQLLS